MSKLLFKSAAQQISPAATPIICLRWLTLSAVEKTPYGKLLYVNGLFGLTSMKDMAQ